MTKTASQTVPQPPPRQTVATKPQRVSGAKDLLVRLTIPLVAAALTFALHLQLHLDVGIAVVIAALAGTCLALLHVNHQRGVVIQAQKRDLMRASHAISAMRAGMPGRQGEARGQPNGAGQPSHASMPSPTLASDPIHGRAVPAQERVTPAEASSPQQNGATVELAPMRTMQQKNSAPVEAIAQAAANEPASSTVTAAREEVAPRYAAPVVASPPPLPPVVIGVKPAQLAAPVASEARTVPMLFEPPAKAETSEPPQPEPARPAPALVEQSLAQHSPTTSATTDADADAPTMAPYWALRPGLFGDTEAPRSPEPESNRRARFDEPVLPTLESAPELDLGSGRSPVQDAPVAESVVIDPVAGPELEAMQRLIEQLATQLNGPSLAAPEAMNAAAPEQPAPTVAETVATSVAALRATADTMRTAADAAAAIHVPGPMLVAIEAAAHSSSPLAQSLPHETDPAVVSEPSMPATATVVKRSRQSRYARLAEASAALAAERIDVLLEPILGLGDRKARHFEVSVRLRNELGAAIEDEGLAEIAAGSGLLPKLDAAKMLRTSRIAGRLEARGTSASLFSTLAGESLEEQSFLDVFGGVFAAESSLLKRVVLSFTQSEVRQFTDGHWQAIEMMADKGLRLAIEDVVDLDMDFEGLREHGFDFVKLDADVFLNGLRAPEGVLPASEICRHFASVGLALIVGHIEDETSLAKVLGFGVIFGQGELFGGARPVSIDTSPPPRTAAA